MVDGVEAGDRIGEKYVVERVIGAGGMGVVVSARHADLGQRVAIKLLRKGVFADSETEQRFFREARALATLQSDHIVRVHDVGRRDDGTPFMVMEYLEGQDLAHVLMERKTVAPTEVVDWILEACSGLAEAHARSLVHRDLKPGNLFLAKRLDGSLRVKVLDFGIAKSTKSQSKLTGARVFLGSPRYMSPEQLHSSRTVDARADIWSIGCVLYRLLSGKAPFDGEELDDILIKIPTGERQDLRELVSDLPEALCAVVDRCLEPDRDKRFGSVVELATALAPVGGDKARELVERIAKITARPMTTGTALHKATQPFPKAAKVPANIDRGAPTRAEGSVNGSADTEPGPPKRATLEPTVDDPLLGAKHISAAPADTPASEPPAATPASAAPAESPRSTPPAADANGSAPPGSASDRPAPPQLVSSLAPRPRARWGAGVVVLLVFLAVAVAVLAFVGFGAFSN